MLPSGYLELEYIENAKKTEYINTGLSGNDIDFELNLRLSELTSDYYFFGRVGGDGQNYYRLGVRNNKLCLTLNSTNYLGNTTIETNNRYKINTDILSSIKKIYLNDNEEISQNVSFPSTNVKIYLFGYNNNSVLTRPISFRLYRCKAKQNGVLVRDYIPAMRLSDKVVGLYDQANDVFYTNQGSGTFKFAFLNDEDAYKVIENCEYLQSSGTQWIDTNVIPTNNSKVDVKYSVVSKNSNDQYIFGCNTTNNDRFFEYYHNNYLGVGYGNTYNESLSSPVLNEIYNDIFDYSDNKLILSGSHSLGLNVTTIPFTKTICLFSKENGNNKSNIKIYHFKYYNNGALVRDFQPVVFNNVGYLYDKVEHKLYGNDGTGVFTYPSHKVSVIINSSKAIGKIKIEGEGYYDNAHLLATKKYPYKFLNWTLNGYTKLEYIESITSQFINLESNNTTATFGRYVLEIEKNTENGEICGVNSANYGLNLWCNGKILQVACGSTNQTTGLEISTVGIHTIDITANSGTLQVKVDDNYTSLSYASTLNTGNLNLFKIGNIKNFKLYSFNILDSNGNYIKKLIPVIRDSDGKIGLFDLVNMKFYQNAGSGYFIGGEIV